jgi:hypothetical protein
MPFLVYFYKQRIRKGEDARMSIFFISVFLYVVIVALLSVEIVTFLDGGEKPEILEYLILAALFPWLLASSIREYPWGFATNAVAFVMWQAMIWMLNGFSLVSLIWLIAIFTVWFALSWLVHALSDEVTETFVNS